MIGRDSVSSAKVPPPLAKTKLELGSWMAACEFDFSAAWPASPGGCAWDWSQRVRPS